MLVETKDQAELEALIDKRIEEKLNQVFYGRSVQTAEPGWVEKYGKKRVVAAIVTIGLLLTSGCAGISAGAGYAYSRMIKEDSSNASDRITVLVIAFLSGFTSIMLASFFLHMSCIACRTNKAQITEI